MDLLEGFPVVPLGADKIRCPDYSHTSESKIYIVNCDFQSSKVNLSMNGVEKET